MPLFETVNKQYEKLYKKNSDSMYLKKIILGYPFSALTLLIGDWWQEGYPACKKPYIWDPA